MKGVFQNMKLLRGGGPNLEVDANGKTENMLYDIGDVTDDAQSD